MGSNIRFLTAQKVIDAGFASTIVRLMMAVNDMSMANNALEEWCKSDDKRKKDRRSNGRMFYGRVQTAFTFEALEIIKQIRNTKALMDEVEKCDKAVQDRFATMTAFIDSADYKLLVQFRNNAAFHYEVKRSGTAIDKIAQADPNKNFACSQGDHMLDWHYELADKAYETIIVRFIYGIGEDKDAGKESDAILNRVFDTAEHLVLFSRDFITHLTR